jgi:predicted DNA-binding transcriptional regulator AlpA
MKTEIKRAPLELVGANGLARMLSVSPRHIWRQKAESKLPKPVSFGRGVRWKLCDIVNCRDMGCPDMTTSDRNIRPSNQCCEELARNLEFERLCCERKNQ